jgi:urease accessory protein
MVDEGGATGTERSLALLLLTDGRFPSGAHAHSLGLEAAVATGLVADVEDLRAWLEGCLGTTWRLDAAVAVQAFGLARRGAPAGAGAVSWAVLDAEVTARTTSPLLRRVSRQLGRQLLRAGSRTWPSAFLASLPDVHPDGPHVAVVQGAVAASAGLGVTQAALVTLHGAVQLAASAAVRLLGLDPYAVTALVADLGPHLATVADEVVGAAGDGPTDLPAAGAPMTDVLLAHHAVADGRLFSS